MAGAGTTPRFAWGATFDSSNNDIQFNEGGGSAVATISLGGGTSATYFWLGDGSADDLVLALKTALDAASAASLNSRTYTVTVEDDGSLEIQSSVAAVWTIEWSHANTTASDALFGFNDADEPSDGSGSLTSSFQIGNIWNPEAPYVQDDEDRPRYRVVTGSTATGRARTQRWGGRTHRRILCDHLASDKIFQAEETTNEAFERFFDEAISQGQRFYFTPDVDTPATTSDYVWDPDHPEGMAEMPITIPSRLVRLYDVELWLMAYVA